MKVIKTSAVIIGAIIGAGFASGKEIFEYFAKYGVYSILFLIPLFIFFSFFIYIYLQFGFKTKGLDYKACNKLLCKDFKKINPFNFMLFCSFLILSSAMFSALVAMCETYFVGGSKIIFFIVATIITFIVIYTPFNKLSSLSNIIVPLIVFCIILNVICSFKSANYSASFGLTNFLPLPFLTLAYASQNTFFCSFIIMKLGQDTTNRQRLGISLLVSGIICVLILFGILCFLFNPQLAYSDMPFAEISIQINPIFSIIFAVILFGSIITTYVTSITSLKEFIVSSKKHNGTVILVALIVLLSLLDFGKIVAYLYPLIGAFGFIYFYKIYKHNNSLAFNSFFQKSNKKVHSACKQAKHNRAS